MYKPAFSYQDFDVAVTGIASLQNGLLIFERNKTWVWMNPPFGSPPVAITSIIGCSNADSIQKLSGTLTYRTVDGRAGTIDNPVIWQSEHGVFASNGQPPICISEFINSEYVTCNTNASVTVHDSLNGMIYFIVDKGE